MKDTAKQGSDLFTGPPKGMRPQPRDLAILQAIQDFDGVLSRSQIRRIFWPDKSLRSMERRLAKLQQAGYLAWPDQSDYKTKPIPEPICWIGWRGALTLAGLQGIEVSPPPKGDNEYQLRELDKALRKQDFRWVRTPRWSLLLHDLAVNDFRLSVLRSLDDMSGASMQRWVNESYFRANLETVEYSIPLRYQKTREVKKGVCPDGYFEILDEVRLEQQKPALYGAQVGQIAAGRLSRLARSERLQNQTHSGTDLLDWLEGCTHPGRIAGD